MLRLELPGRRPRERPKRRFMDEVKEDMKLVGVREEGADGSLWRPLTGTAERKGNKELY